MANVGFIVGGVGIAAVAGGLIWHFLEPTGEKTAGLVPQLGPGYAGMALSGTF